MRIVHVQRAKGIAGSERHLLALLPALAELGHDVVAVVPNVGDGERFVADLRAQNLDVVPLPMRGHLDPLLLANLIRIMRRVRPDVVHTHLVHADVHGQVAAAICRVPGVSTIHGASELFTREPTRSVAALAGRLARRKITISHHLADFVQRHRLAPLERIRVVPYGLDLAHWRVAVRPVERDTRVLVAASRLIPGKGHDFLLEAFARARKEEPRLRLRVAGDGPTRGQLETMASTLGIESYVEFLGFVDDVSALVADSDALVFPTLPSCGEGFGLVALEAMALATPVIATRVGAIPEVVKHGVTGLLVEPGDVPGLTAELLRIARDDDLRARLGRAGRARAEERFRLELMVDGILAVYEESLS